MLQFRKSAWIKNALSGINEQSVIVALKSTDFDMKNKEEFMLLYGELLIDEFLNLYGDADQRILYVDAVEKYFILENQQTFEDIIYRHKICFRKQIISNNKNARL